MPKAKEVKLTPPKTLVEYEAEKAKVETPKAESENLATKPLRPTRKPVSGKRDILVVKDKDPNFHYRWVIDRGHRLDQFKEGGYEIVRKVDATVGKETVNSSQGLGSAVTYFAGGGDTLVLMRIPREWYEEDQQTKQDDLDEKESLMHQELVKDGHYGQMSTTSTKSRATK